MRVSKVIRGVWALCLFIGGINHARIWFEHGPTWDHGGVNPLSAAYWSSLTVLDPLVAALLFVRPRIGVPSTIVLIGTNVAHNLAITAQRAAPHELLARIAGSPFLISQIAFLLFVAISAPSAWRGLDRRHESPLAR